MQFRQNRPKQVHHREGIGELELVVAVQFLGNLNEPHIQHYFDEVFFLKFVFEHVKKHHFIEFCSESFVLLKLCVLQESCLSQLYNWGPGVLLLGLQRDCFIVHRLIQERSSLPSFRNRRNLPRWGRWFRQLFLLLQNRGSYYILRHCNGLPNSRRWLSYLLLDVLIWLCWAFRYLTHIHLRDSWSYAIASLRRQINFILLGGGLLGLLNALFFQSWCCTANLRPWKQILSGLGNGLVLTSPWPVRCRKLWLIQVRIVTQFGCRKDWAIKRLLGWVLSIQSPLIPWFTSHCRLVQAIRNILCLWFNVQRRFLLLRGLARRRPQFTSLWVLTRVLGCSVFLF